MELTWKDITVHLDAVSAQLAAELELVCQQNGWLCYNGYAWQDDPYLEQYPYAFARAKSLDELTSFMEHGNWSIRQGIVFDDLAFIQQVDGGDEWWTLKRTDNGWMPFENTSAGFIIERDGVDAFTHMVECMHRATPEQCRHFDYMQATAESLTSRSQRAQAASTTLPSPCPSRVCTGKEI